MRPHDGAVDPVVPLQLTLSPGVVGGAGVLSRRLGPRAGGLLVGLPLTSGPVALVLAVRDGPGPAAGLACGLVAGVAAQAAFAVAYTRLCERGRGWIAAALAAAAAYALTGAALIPAGLSAAALLPCAVAAVALGLRFSPGAVRARAPRGGPQPPGAPCGLALRMALSAGLVFALTKLAPVLGSGAAGVVTSFPLLTSLVAVFAHREDGAGAAIAVYRGSLAGLFAVTGFAAALTWLLARLPVPAAFVLAAAVALAIQVCVSWRKPGRGREPDRHE